MPETTPDPADVHTGTDRVELAAILAKHTRNDGPQYIACICGWTHIGGYPTGARPHTQHLASMVLESEWLRRIRAKELRDAADSVHGDERAEGYNPDPVRTAAFLRSRADRVDAEDGGR